MGERMEAGRKPTLRDKVIEKAGIAPEDSAATKLRKVLAKVPGYVRGKASDAKRRVGMLRRQAQLVRFERKYLTAVASGIDPLPQRHAAADERLVVSLTSYGERLQTVRLAVLSMLDQTVQADKVVLYLDEGTDAASLPEQLVRLCGPRFEIRSGYPNLKPHTKYVYAMREFPEASIITVDDDALYARDAIETLLAGHELHLGCVIARRVHKMERDATGALKSYNDWSSEWRKTREPRSELLATGVGGVLYPPHCIPATALDAQAIRTSCLGADDIWLKVAEVAVGVRVVYVSNRMNHPLTIGGTQEQTLNAANVHEHENDAWLAAAMKYFGVTAEMFFD